MNNKVLFLVALVPCCYGLLFNKNKCVVDPIENRWPDKVKVCNEELPYNHAAIEQALQDDQEMKMFIEDASRIYKPAIPYSDLDICAVDIEGTINDPQIVECGAICPSINVTLKTVWYEFEPGRTTMCNVIRPWEQVVYYMECGRQKPNVDGMDDSFQCVPEDIIRRRIAIYCPELPSQCQKMDIDLPQHCAASSFRCKQKVVSKSNRVDDLFGILGW